MALAGCERVPSVESRLRFRLQHERQFEEGRLTRNRCHQRPAEHDILGGHAVETGEDPVSEHAVQRLRRLRAVQIVKQCPQPLEIGLQRPDRQPWWIGFVDRIPVLVIVVQNRLRGGLEGRGPREIAQIRHRLEIGGSQGLQIPSTAASNWRMCAVRSRLRAVGQRRGRAPLVRRPPAAPGRPELSRHRREPLAPHETFPGQWAERRGRKQMLRARDQTQLVEKLGRPSHHGLLVRSDEVSVPEARQDRDADGGGCDPVAAREVRDPFQADPLARIEDEALIGRPRHVVEDGEQVRPVVLGGASDRGGPGLPGELADRAAHVRPPGAELFRGSEEADRIGLDLPAPPAPVEEAEIRGDALGRRVMDDRTAPERAEDLAPVAVGIGEAARCDQCDDVRDVHEVLLCLSETVPKEIGRLPERRM